ncbi:TetR/AcrR family transcriptional regulator [Conexibacter sp. JD483]|uniref:TetR/AcrR family transcriptional regulator n=1 Tax=unclassified Conexibacter TaxID=2627773 RepID=UPI0027185BB5|nr:MULTISPECIES: TetR/AcrR family transcriptional regulator [unclassified Conexibacter]MDO8187827.1 TetR/AcrR family transcriptional regulator [Conexibacter sp. CPCC 205706]MDO8199964.1 TetR/AcrR family transcriptional regulator [Conexibacter sp. CPCC 205762]MDR9369491.1 TetR/AcrR family transcriptional regulator [Conexibacter sp. JD483]
MSRTAPTPPPSESAPPRVRPDIIEAATRIFSERGYHAASMSEIADALGMRKPSLYHHVRKKEDLLFAIHEQLIDELIEETLAVVSTSERPADKLRGALRVALGFVARHRDGVTVFLQERSAVSGERWNALVVKRDFYEQMVTRIVAEGSAAGDFVAVDPAIATKAVLAMANWGYTWFQPDGPLSADAVADTFATVALRGLEVR